MTRLVVHPSSAVARDQVIVSPAPEVVTRIRDLFVHPDRAADLQDAIVQRDREAARVLDAVRAWERLLAASERGADSDA